MANRLQVATVHQMQAVPLVLLSEVQVLAAVQAVASASAAVDPAVPAVTSEYTARLHTGEYL